MDYILLFLIVATFTMCTFLGYKYGERAANLRWKKAKIKGELK